MKIRLILFLIFVAVSSVNSQSGQLDSIVSFNDNRKYVRAFEYPASNEVIESLRWYNSGERTDFQRKYFLNDVLVFHEYYDSTDRAIRRIFNTLDEFDRVTELHEEHITQDGFVLVRHRSNEYLDTTSLITSQIGSFTDTLGNLLRYSTFFKEYDSRQRVTRQRFFSDFLGEMDSSTIFVSYPYDSIKVAMHYYLDFYGKLDSFWSKEVTFPVEIIGSDTSKIRIDKASESWENGVSQGMFERTFIYYEWQFLENGAEQIGQLDYVESVLYPNQYSVYPAWYATSFNAGDRIYQKSYTENEHFFSHPNNYQTDIEKLPLISTSVAFLDEFGRTDSLKLYRHENGDSLLNTLTIYYYSDKSTNVHSVHPNPIKAPNQVRILSMLHSERTYYNLYGQKLMVEPIGVEYLLEKTGADDYSMVLFVPNE